MKTKTLPSDGKSVTVIYHASCYDGFCAAWLLHLVYPDADFVPMQYGGEYPVDFYDKILGRNVFIVDFSFGRLVMDELIKNAQSLVCLDHHKTAEEALAGLPGCEFDMYRSGAQMVWDYLADNLGETWKLLLGELFDVDTMHETSDGSDYRHWLVEYTADRDLWKWELYESRNVNAAIRLVEFDFEKWDTMAAGTANSHSLVVVGQTVSTYLARRAEGAVKNAKMVNVFPWHKVGKQISVLSVPCVNVTDPNVISDVGHLLAKEYDGIGMTYFFDGTQFVFSLRSIGDIDVGKIAHSFGGGGHKNAAGFKRAEFFELIPATEPLPA